MLRYDSYSLLEFMEIAVLNLLQILNEDQEIKVTRIAAQLGTDFDKAYGLCLLLSDDGITEQLSTKRGLEGVGFRLTEKGRLFRKSVEEIVTRQTTSASSPLLPSYGA